MEWQLLALGFSTLNELRASEGLPTIITPPDPVSDEQAAQLVSRWKRLHALPPVETQGPPKVPPPSRPQPQPEPASMPGVPATGWPGTEVPQ